MFQITDDVNIAELRPLVSPAILMEELPIDKKITDLVIDTRKQASDIIQGHNHRLLVVVGPCSIHDPAAALDYAKKLHPLIKKHSDQLVIIMRVYFEKPRTTVGWKGLINDPELNGSFAINKGLHVARKLLLDINHLGIPCGTEFLDTIIPQFIGDLITWGAIGARTTESQIHRELASGLSTPVGFKNGTGGSIGIAIDAVKAAEHSHHFLSVTKQGISAIVKTKGNPACHIILRGSKAGPNYDDNTINQVVAKLEQATLHPRLMIDCSHGNSNKDHRQQIIVAEQVAVQIANGNHAICGVMLESNLVAGNQTVETGKPLTYGQSITDACMDIAQTEQTLATLANAVATRQQHLINA